MKHRIVECTPLYDLPAIYVVRLMASFPVFSALSYCRLASTPALSPAFIACSMKVGKAGGGLGTRLTAGNAKGKEAYVGLRLMTLIASSYPSTEPVTSVSFSRDGHCVLVSSLDGRLRLLDKESGEMLNE